MNKNYSKLIWGGAFILLGILVALNVAGIIAFDSWKSLWPIVLIVIGISIVVKEKKNFWGYLIICLGIFIILKQQLEFELDWKYLGAGILIFIGFSIAFNSFRFKEYNVTGSNKKLNQFVIFGGRTDKINDPEYVGTNTLCLFGGHEIDLRNLVVVRDIEIDATALFGGVTIFLPTNINIKTISMPIFGGVENATQNSQNNPYTIFIKANAIFGGVEIRN